MELRPYQKDALNAIQQNFSEGITRQLVTWATGAGKTVLFATLAKKINCTTLIIAHRNELLLQAEDKLRMIWHDADIGRCKAEENQIDRQIVIASIQTICKPKRLEQLKREGFQLCIVDECHRSAAKSYLRVFNALGFMEGNKDKLLLGVTATPDRTDNVGLNNIYEKEVASVSLLRLIRAGFLCDLRGIRIKTHVDLSSVRTARGDFVESELSLLINTPEQNALIVDAFKEHAKDRKTIVFCADINHVEDLTAAFRLQGIPAAAIHGKLKQEEKQRVLADYASGKICVLVNCMLLIEGYDDPPTSAIIMARPTKSRIVYSQAIGRGTRTFPGKKDCLVIDLFDSRHDICALPGILGKPLDEMQNGESVRESEERVQRGKEKIAAIVTKQREEEIDLLGKSQFRWLPVGERWILTIQSSLLVELTPQDGRYRVEVVEKKQRRKLHPSPLDIGYAMGLAEDYARQQPIHLSSRDARWRNDPISKKQRELLLEMGMDAQKIANFTKGDASDAIAILMNQAG